MMADVIPSGIVLRASQLCVRWADGEAVLGAAALRAACRCANCRAAALSGRTRDVGPDVRLAGASAVGQYAVRLLFNDGHDRGIYPWELLRQLSSAGRSGPLQRVEVGLRREPLMK
jgi:DUF971 family protein